MSQQALTWKAASASPPAASALILACPHGVRRASCRDSFQGRRRLLSLLLLGLCQLVSRNQDCVRVPLPARSLPAGLLFLPFSLAPSPNSPPAPVAPAIIARQPPTDIHSTATNTHSPSDGTLVAAMALLGQAQQHAALTCSSQCRPLSVCTSLVHRAQRDQPPAFLFAQLRTQATTGSERGSLCVLRAATLGAPQVPHSQRLCVH